MSQCHMTRHQQPPQHDFLWFLWQCRSQTMQSDIHMQQSKMMSRTTKDPKLRWGLELYVWLRQMEAQYWGYVPGNKGNISVYLPTNCKTAFKYHSARTCCLPSQDPDGFGYPLSLYITQLILDEHLGTSLSISMAVTGTCFLQNSLILHLNAHFSLCCCSISRLPTSCIFMHLTTKPILEISG